MRFPEKRLHGGNTNGEGFRQENRRSRSDSYFVCSFLREESLMTLG